ncbi:M1 family aminopeptidase [Nocardioides sp.]|uniref:M1 family aminopeptidase n=1 Tax=Nocardioides sp. TaxID=35761 RepID=UPI002B6A7183|nr:M1 family aminopeptidase [Nocardioides sp.]HXH77753.1 M1 family aminopeptidase [Nocardioides sp.]
MRHLERDLDELVTLTRQGLSFFGDKFGIPFPQSRYDQVFVPNLGGAMENWGCVTYGDSQLFRTPPSHNQRAVRAEFVLHEMAHMWFGDLVTMRWWDDLWLNEAFASWASNWAMAEATEFTDQWASFLALYKRTAYDMDMGPGRHPIRGEVIDVNGAMANFDAITYVKGQSVLHQLMAFIGEDAFVEGLRAYFAAHAYGNTVLDDLMSAYAGAAGQDLSSWTAAWLDRAGTDVLALDGDTIRAESSDDDAPRPHRVDIASYSVTGDVLERVAVTPALLTGDATRVDLPEGDLRLLNADDLTFAAVRPDAESLRLMLRHLGAFPEPLSRALVLGTITQLLLLAELAPRDAATAISTALHTERNPALVEPFLSVGSLVADRWAPPAESPALRSALADAALVLSRDPEHRQPALRTLAASASTEEHWSAAEEAASASADSDLAWRMAIRRAELGQRDDDALAQMLDRDPDPDAGIKRLKVLAASPDSESKEAVWRAFFVDYAVPASRETLELGAIFWRPGQGDLLAPYTHRYLEELPDLKGGMLNQGVVVRGMYPHAVGDASFLEAAEAASEDDAISQYARNQVRAQSFVLAQLNRAREL